MSRFTTVTADINNLTINLSQQDQKRWLNTGERGYFADRVTNSTYGTRTDAVDDQIRALEIDTSYHVERARTELDLALRAQNTAAAEAHRKLSALHMGRIKQLDESCTGSGLATAR